MDVHCLDHRGIRYIVEMQVRKTRAFLKRIQYNAAKVYVNQIASAEEYPKLNQVIAITITDFNLFNEIDHYLSHHQTREMITGKPLLREISYYFIELSKFNKPLKKLDTILDKWIFFIKMARTLDEVPDRLQEKPFPHAFEKARVANMDQQELEYYDKACMAIADARGAIELALEEGEQKGIQKGIQKGRKEGEQIGEQKGGAFFLLLMLEEKFGSVSNSIRDRVLGADQKTLKEWSFRLLKSDTLDGVFCVVPRIENG